MSWGQRMTGPCHARVALQVEPGLLRVHSWQSSRVQASNVTFTCSLSAAQQQQQQQLLLEGTQGLGSNSSSWPPPSLSCAVGHAATWEELVAASRRLQAAAARVHVLLTGNVTLHVNHTSADSFTVKRVALYRRVRVAAHPALPDMTYVKLGPLYGEVGRGCSSAPDLQGWRWAGLLVGRVWPWRQASAHPGAV